VSGPPHAAGRVIRDLSLKHAICVLASNPKSLKAVPTTEYVHHFNSDHLWQGKRGRSSHAAGIGRSQLRLLSSDFTHSRRR
jgi:hypothetical protein